MQVPQRSVVVFSKNYLPIAQVNLKRAVVLLVTGKAESLDWGNSQFWQVKSPSLVVQVPAYIRLRSHNQERAWKVPPVNRRGVLRRDGYTCQYCGSSKPLTIDHVIPRSRGGMHRWDNVVTACESCNGRKGNRTPQEAGMTLKTKPKAPAHPAIAFAEQFFSSPTKQRH